jgi:uncharacterized membrane protein
MPEAILLTAGLAAATFAIRLGGYLIGARLPTTGRWVRAFDALPGCLIAALVTLLLAQGDWPEWLAAAIALAVAIPTRSLPATMLAGIVVVAVLRGLA